jgi:nucleoporin POM152
LSTATPGHKIYDFSGISDANYAQLTKNGLVAPDQSNKAGRVRLEQDVLARPTVLFLEQDRKPVFCVNDALDSSHSHTPSIRLTGTAPFRVELEISPDGSQTSQRYSDIFIKSNNWKLHLPQHVFAESGPYTVSLRKVVDATGCEKVIPRGTKGSLVRLDVAETASLAAVQPQQDHCVGDSIDFVLQGSAPWTVQYEFEGKKQRVTAKDSRFSRVAEQPGNFKIVSVAQ